MYYPPSGDHTPGQFQTLIHRTSKCTTSVLMACMYVCYFFNPNVWMTPAPASTTPSCPAIHLLAKNTMPLPCACACVPNAHDASIKQFYISCRRSGKPMDVSELSRSFSISAYRITGQKTNPHLIRDIVVTHARYVCMVALPCWLCLQSHVQRLCK